MHIYFAGTAEERMCRHVVCIGAKWFSARDFGCNAIHNNIVYVQCACKNKTCGGAHSVCDILGPARREIHTQDETHDESVVRRRSMSCHVNNIVIKRARYITYIIAR